MSELPASSSATPTRFPAVAFVAALSLPSFSLLACASAAPSETTASGAEAVESTLAWVGSTSLSYALPQAPPGSPPYELGIPASFVVAQNDLTVSTQTYPSGAARTVTLHWANADSASTGSVAMALTGSDAGDYGDNDSFRAILPGSALTGGAVTYYWISAEDAAGNVLYDSNSGANYALTPRALSIGWAGNLGAYDAQGGPTFYRVGELFNADLSTTVGCVENGYDDYPIQAVQVYVPGLTDQGYTGDLATAVTAILQAQLWTDMQPTGWGPIATTCQPGTGNNYVCAIPLTVFPEPPGCLPNGNVPAGTYQYKMRFSIDGGSTWYWTGTEDGNGGGDNLSVYYAPTCSYAENDLASCSQAR